MLIPENHPLAAVRDAYNAVFIHGDAIDDLTFMGRGAGEMPTASAVLGDIVDAARDIMYDCCGFITTDCYKKLPVKKADECICKYFLRLQVEDKPGVLANIAQVLGNNDVSIAQVFQKSVKKGTAELVIVTDSVIEKNFNKALESFKTMSVIHEISGIIRVY